MDVHEAIRMRYSVREYQSTPVPDDSLFRVLEAARLAPSSSNRQEWQFVVVRDEGRRNRLAAATNGQAFIAQAPIIIAAIGTDSQSVMTCEVPRYAVDVSIAVTQMMLAAVQEGLGTCWIGAFSQPRVKEILDVGPGCTVVTIMPLGYSSREQPPEKSRKRLEDIVGNETFSR